MRLTQTLIRRLLTRPLRDAVIDDQRTWRAIDLYIAALHVAKAVEQRSKAQHLGIMLPTSGMFPVALVAGWMLGRPIVPLNYLLSRDELDFVIDDSEIDAVVTVQPMLDYVGGLPGGIEAIRLENLSFSGFPPLRRSARRDNDDLAVLLYTSGTSGRPKGVMLTFGNLAVNARQCRGHAQFTRGDSFLGVLPQFHSFGFTVLTLLPLLLQCPVIYTARFNPSKILKLLRKHRPSAFIAIPSMYNALLHAKSAREDDFNSAKYLISGGEPLPDAVSNRFYERFKMRINEGYGLTETAPVSNMCLPEEYRPHSVGRAVPDLVQRIVDNNENIQPPGKEGEVRMRGPNIMKGYFKRPEETKAAFDRNGFYRTGDLGRQDDDGHLYITGRIKELLIIGGENVAPREIEEVLNAHPSVSDSAVIGMRDPSRGEVPLAFIELVEDAEFDESALRSHCRESLAQYKVPREIRVVEELPRGPTGKVLRRKLTVETQSETPA